MHIYDYCNASVLKFFYLCPASAYSLSIDVQYLEIFILLKSVKIFLHIEIEAVRILIIKEFKIYLQGDI